MNLDLLPLGWVHLIASLVALMVGGAVLLRPKGTPVHRLHGKIYALTILVASVTALGIYRGSVFFFPHWLAVATVITIVIGVSAAHFKVPRSGWVHLHLTCMLLSYYILIGGGVNEIFLRIDYLRSLVPNLKSPLLGMTHFAVILFFAILIAYFNAMILMRSRASRSA